MKASVIIPAYNAELTIEKCILSVVDDCSCMEIIVINDGSIDNTEKIVRKLAKKKKKIHLISSRNGGVSRARNIGIKCASGDFLLFLDSDDYLSTDAITKMVKKSENDNIDLCCINVIEENTSKSLANQYLRITKDKIIDTDSIGKIINHTNPRSACAKLYRTDLIKKNDVLFDESMSYAEDYEFVLKYLMSVKKVGFCKNATYNIQNVNPSSLSKKYHLELENAIDKKNKTLLELFEVYPEYKIEYFNNEIGLGYSKVISISDNVFRIGTPYKFYEAYKEIKKEMKKFINTEEFRNPMSYQLPKKKIDRVYYFVIHTKSALLMSILFWSKNHMKREHFS